MTTLPVRATALAGALGLLLSATACGSSGDDHGGHDSGAAKLPTYPSAYRGAHRLAQAVGDRGATSVTLHFTPDGVEGPAFAYCVGAPRGSQVLLTYPGTSYRMEGEMAVPCSSGPPKRLTAGGHATKWIAVPKQVGRPTTVVARLVTTRVDEMVEAVIAKPVTDAPDVRIVAAAYAAR